MADQNLDFEYRVKGDRDVTRSLKRIEGQIGDVSTRLDKLGNSNKGLNGVQSGFSKAAGGAKSLVRGVTGIAAAITGIKVVKLRALSGVVEGIAHLATAAAAGVRDVGEAAVRAAARSVKIAGDLANTASRIALTTAAVGAAAAVAGGREIVQADQEFQSLSLSLEQATGSAAGAAEQLKFISSIAETLGVDVGQVGPGFATLANAIKAAGGTIDDAQQAFLGVNRAGQALGRTNDQIALSLKALTDSASKGRISMEEISGQMSESLPGALGIAARSMGKTTAEFTALVSTGQLEAIPFLRKFSAELNKTFAGGAMKAADDFQSSRARLSNQFRILKEDIAKGGVVDALKEGLNDMTESVRKFNADGGGVRLGAKIAAGMRKLRDNVKKYTEDIRSTFIVLTKGYRGLFDDIAKRNPMKASAQFGGTGTSDGGQLEKFRTQVERTAPIVSVLNRVRQSVLYFIAVGRQLFYELQRGAKAARLAYLDFIYGAFGTGPQNVAKGAVNSILQLVDLIVGGFERLANSRAFFRFGVGVRRVYDSIIRKAQELTGTDTFGEFFDFIVAKARKFLADVGYIFDSVVYFIRAVGSAFEALAPAFAPILRELGVVINPLNKVKSTAELLASPFIYLGQVLNQLVANGSITKFAEKVGDGLNKTIAYAKEFGTVLGLASKRTALGDETIKVAHPDFAWIIDARDMMDLLIAKIKSAAEAVDGFWKKWGPSITAAKDKLIEFLEPLAKFFGVKNGEQVLILIILFKLIGGFTVLGAILSVVFAVFNFIAFISFLTLVVSLVGGLATGTLTAAGAFGLLKKILLNLAFGKIFGAAGNLVQTLTNLVIGAIKDIGRLGNALKVAFNAIRAQGLIGAIRSALTIAGTNIVAGLAPIGTAILGFLEVLGGAIVAFFTSPVGIILAIVLAIAAAFALLYKYWDQVTAFFTEVGEGLKSILINIFGDEAGTAIYNKIKEIFDGLVAPIKAVIDLIGVYMEEGFDGIGKRIAKSFEDIPGQIKAYFAPLWADLKDLGSAIANANGKLAGDVFLGRNRPYDSNGKMIPGYAKGGIGGNGMVYGPGTGTSDSILVRMGRGLARIAKGEYIVNAKSTKKHRSVLDAINFGRLPKFATGGFIGGMQGSSKEMSGGSTANVYLPEYMGGGQLNIPTTRQGVQDLTRDFARRTRSQPRRMAMGAN